MVDIADLDMSVDVSDLTRAEKSIDKLSQSMSEVARYSSLFGRKMAGEFSLASNKIAQANQSIIRMRERYAKQEADTSRLVINAQRGLLHMQNQLTAEQDKQGRLAFQRTLALQKAREQEAAAAEKAAAREIAAKQRTETKADSQFRQEYQRILTIQKARDQEAAAADKAAAREIAAAQRVEQAKDARFRQEYQQLMKIQDARERAAATAERAAQREAAAAKRAEIAESNKRTGWIKEQMRMTALYEADQQRRAAADARALASAENSGRGIIGSLSRIHGVMLSLSGVAAGIGVLALYNSLNKYTELTNIFKVLGFEGEQAAEKLREIQDVARITRSPVEELSKIYQKTTMASKELGASQEEIITFTKNIGLALAQQGGATISTRGALLQLAQAVGMGTVRAEEFNSMLEGGYPILVAAARGIEETGGSVMKLRMMMLDGELSSKKFFEAILSQSENLEKTFGRTVPTLSQSLTVLRDTFMVSMGEMDHAVGFSETLSRGIMTLSASMVDLSRFVTVNADTIRMFGSVLTDLGLVLTSLAVVHFGRKLIGAITAAGGAMQAFTKVTTLAATATKALLPAFALASVASAISSYMQFKQVMLDYSEATKAAKQSITDLNVALSTYDSQSSVSANIMKAQSQETISRVQEEIRLLEEKIAIQETMAATANTPFTQQLKDDLSNANAELVRATGLLGMADGAVKSLIQSVEGVSLVTDGMTDKAIATASQVADKVEQQIELAQALVTYGEKSAQVEAVKRQQAISAAEAFALQEGFNVAISEEYVKQQTALYDLNKLAEQQATHTDLVAEAWKEINKVISERHEKERERDAEAEKTIATYERQIELSEALLKYGEKSAKAEALRREEVRLSAEETARLNGYTDTQTQLLVEAALKAYDMSSALENSAASADYLSSRLSVATGFAAQLLATLGGVPGAVLSLAGQVDAVVGQLQKQNATLNYQIKDGISAAAAGVKVLRDEAVKTGVAAGMSLDAAAKLGQEYDKEVVRVENLTKSNEGMTESLRAAEKAAKGAGKAKKGGADAAKKAAKEAEKLSKQLDEEAERWKEQLDPVYKYKKEIGELVKLQGRLSTGEMTKAMQQLNAEFADSLPLVGDLTDTLVDGLFNGFKGTLKSLLGIFKNWLAEMISMAIKNKIVVSMGAQLGGGGIPGLGSGTPDLLSQTLGSIPGVGGTGILGGLGKIGASFSKGLGGVISGVTGGFSNGGIFGAISGGLSSSISGITGGLAAGGIPGIASAIGAAVPILGAVAGVVAIGKKLFGRTLKDTGIEATFSMAEGIAASTYKFYKGGLLRSDKTKRSDMDKASSSELGRSFQAAYDTIEGYAKTLGLATKNMKNVTASFKFSTKGLSEEDIKAKFEQEVTTYADSLARAATTVTTKVTKSMLAKQVGAAQKATKTVFMGRRDLDNDNRGRRWVTKAMVEASKVEVASVTKRTNLLLKYAKAGESSSKALERLATSLNAANTAFDLLGLKLMDVSLAGGARASFLADQFGGLDNMTSSIQTYYEAFYTDQEKRLKLTQQVNKSLRQLGITKTPKSLDEYRKIVEQMSRVDTKKFAELIKLAPAFAQMIASVNSGMSASEILEQRNSLENEYYQLIGDKVSIRQRELRQLDASNRSLQNWIWRLEDLQSLQATAENALKASVQARKAELSTITTMSSTIRNLATTTKETAFKISEEQRLSAVRQLRTAIQTGRVADESMTKLAERASAIDSKNFSSQTEYLIASAQAAATLNALADRQDEYVTAEEARLDRILSKYGLADETVKSLDQSISDLNRILELISGTRSVIENQENVIISQYQRNKDEKQAEQLESVKIELQTLREENRQLLMYIGENTRRTDRMFSSWNVIGLPPERSS